MEELLLFVQKVRSALEQDATKKAYVGFYDFPAGACMDASTLLGILQERNGFGEYNLISAWNKKGRQFSHAWLENAQYLIDITADQFAGWPYQALVIKFKEKPAHYAAFRIQFKEPVLKHANVPDLGFYTALSMASKAVES